MADAMPQADRSASGRHSPVSVTAVHMPDHDVVVRRASSRLSRSAQDHDAVVRRASSRLSRVAQQESLASNAAMVVNLPDPDDVHPSTAAMIVNDPYTSVDDSAPLDELKSRDEALTDNDDKRGDDQPEAEPPAPTYLQKLLGRHHQAPPAFAIRPSRIAVMFLQSAIASLALGLLTAYETVPHGGVSYALMIPSFGASAALLYGAPELPSAQPKNAFFGHLVGALVGLAMGHALHHVDTAHANYIAGALAIAITVPLNAILAIPHPPSCATTFIAAGAVRTAAMGEAFIFLVFPVATGMAIMILVACIGNNILDGPYPLYWY
jgi:hypothetical protein